MDVFSWLFLTSLMSQSLNRTFYDCVDEYIYYVAQWGDCRLFIYIRGVGGHESS